MPGTTVIIVGAGTAGSVVARRLVDQGATVTLVDAGGEDLNPAIHDPSRMGELWGSPDDWGFYTVPQEHANHRRLRTPRGKVLGGSDAFNAMIWVRGAPQDYDDWAALGNTGWSWAQVKEAFDAIEDYQGQAQSQRGKGGPVPVTDTYPLSPIQEAIIEAAIQEGLEYNPDYNSGNPEGVSKQQVTMQNGERINTWKSFLKPRRQDLQILTGCEVHSVVVEDGRAVAIRYRETGQFRELAADHIVLCAGALCSPAILLRSGIGAAPELAKSGVKVVHDLPGVGQNLHDHLLSPVIFTANRPIGKPAPGVSPTQSHLFWKSQPELAVPDTQPIHFSVPMFGDTLEAVAEEGFTLMAGIVTPLSRGQVRITGPSLDDPLEIDPNVFAHPADLRSLVASLRQCRSIGRRPALAEDWGAVELYPGPGVPDDSLDDYARQTVTTYHHHVGTCRMGTGEDAVVDPRLRVRGIEGLRVIDASIMPKVTTGNTNAPSAVIGELGARMLAADLA